MKTTLDSVERQRLKPRPKPVKDFNYDFSLHAKPAVEKAAAKAAKGRTASEGSADTNDGTAAPSADGDASATGCAAAQRLHSPAEMSTTT